jgi:hypothetical protein
MSNDVLSTLQSLKSHFLLQLSEMPEYRAMKALEKTIAEVTEILSVGQGASHAEQVIAQLAPQLHAQVSTQTTAPLREAQHTQNPAPSPLRRVATNERAIHNDTEASELRTAEAAIASVIPARTASPTALRIPTMPMTRRF